MIYMYISLLNLYTRTEFFIVLSLLLLFLNSAATPALISGIFCRAILCHTPERRLYTNTGVNSWHTVFFSPHAPPTRSLAHFLPCACWRAATGRSSVGVKHGTNLGGHKGKCSHSAELKRLHVVTRDNHPPLSTPPPPPPPSKPSPVPPLPHVISICEDNRSSRMQVRQSAGMHIYLAAQAGVKVMGRVWELTLEWCSIFTLTQRHSHVNMAV